jgi:hypothetical protein
VRPFWKLILPRQAPNWRRCGVPVSGVFET